MSEREVSVDLLDGVVKRGSETAPITNYFFDGDDDAEFVSVRKCLRVVAGPFPGGKWIAAEVTDEERAEAGKLH
jgi:hypothetical protein